MTTINVNKTLLKAKSLLKKGEVEAAERLFTAVLEAYPQNRQAALGLASIRQGGAARTSTESTQALQQDLQTLVSLFNEGDLPRVLETGRAMASRYPDQPLVHNVLGAAYAGVREFESAIDSYRRAVKLQPDYAEAFNNLGAAFNEIGRHEEAVASYRKAIRFNTRFYEAHNNLGNALADLGKQKAAIDSYSAAVSLKPDYAMAAAKRVLQLAQICEWDSPHMNAASIAELGVAGEKVFPFDLLALEDHPARHRLRSELYARRTFTQPVPVLPQRPDEMPKRLRIGYFSADFKDHATMYLMARLFELHDRNTFEIFAYAYGSNANDAMRTRVSEAVDEFHDVSAMTDSEIVELCGAHAIDIAVDLKGYTQETRMEIFAHRLAPVQISYLGYPGTSGAPFIDYLIADERVVPVEQAAHYSEQLIYLPHSYQVNDNTRVIADKTITRAEAGLPEAGFVFCCFNNNFKIGAAEFECWMRVLLQVEGSVLWLFGSNELAQGNLRRQARSRGVAPERLVFAERLPQAEHLARHRLADLFLDTFNYNAHTTTSDALWAGLPVVTRAGEGFAARVAGSLLHAMGVDELVTQSTSEYVQLALELALNPARLDALKEKLARNRLTTPLFDSALFTRHLEDAYQQAYQHFFEGREPLTISVQP